MKLLIFTLSLISAAMLLAFCKHTKYSSENLPKEQVRFGRGGGFAGIEKSYTLLENGQLFESGTTELGGVKHRLAKSAFKTIGNLKLSELDFKHPGNTYSFIEVPIGTEFHRMSWGDANYPVDAAVQKAFNQLMGLIPEKKD